MEAPNTTWGGSHFVVGLGFEGWQGGRLGWKNGQALTRL